MECTFTQARCHIDLAALQRNFARCGTPDRLMPVIKADAYGHGLLQVAEAMEKIGACRFAIGVVDEGVTLRKAGHKQDIVALMPPTDDAEWAAAAENKIWAAAGSFEDLDRARVHGTADTPIAVTIKIETGMHRLGFTKDQIPALIEKLRACPEIEPAVVLSHLSCCDVPGQEEYTNGQYATFTEMSDALRSAFPNIRRSLLNSAGLLTFGKTAPFEIGRPGITLYGGNPYTGTTEASRGAGFEWGMSLETPILQVTELKKGETVSYGRTFTAPRDMRLAVIGAGYATGVPRALSNKLEVLIHGVRCKQVGRVCMSMMMIDVTDLPNVHSGDSAWLLGGKPAEGQTAVTPQDWADALGTISYEVLCLVGTLNKRIYD